MIVEYKSTPCLILEKYKYENTPAYLVIYKNKKILLQTNDKLDLEQTGFIFADYIHPKSKKKGFVLIQLYTVKIEKTYYVYGKTRNHYHREDGFAKINDYNTPEYWINDKKYNTEKSYKIALNRFLFSIKNKK